MRFSHQLRKLLRCVCLVLLSQTPWASAGDAATRVNFLLIFSRFIEWDAVSLDPAASLRFCIAPGDLELSREAPVLEQTQIRGHPIRVVSLSRAPEVAGCNVLFLPAELVPPLAPFLAAAELSGALTVSDLPGFADKGGMVELLPVNGRYQFDINFSAVKRARLYMSTKLLKLARSVK